MTHDVPPESRPQGSRPRPPQSPADSADRYRPQEDADLTEFALLHKAAPMAKAFDGRLPTVAEIKNITEELGIELATALFSRTVQESKGHGSFTRRIRGFDLANWPALKSMAATCEVTVIASQLPQSGRTWGDHVEKWRSWARALGFTTESIDTDARASVAANARLIADFLRSNPHPNRIIVTYGRGASELRLLIQRQQTRGEEPGFRAWINVCGSFHGSSSSAWLNRSRWSRLRSRLALKLAGHDPNAHLETSSLAPMWRKPLRLPQGLLITNLIGLPYRSHIPQGLNRAYHELSKVSPNDGVVTVHEAMAQPGFVVPIPGMSHKAENARLEPVFKRLLGVILESLRKEAEAKRAPRLELDEPEA